MNTKAIIAVCLWALTYCVSAAQDAPTPPPPPPAEDKKIEIKTGDTTIGIDLDDEDDDDDDDDIKKAPKPPKRTTSSFLIATGVNQWLSDNINMENDLGRSWFSEFGFIFKSKLGNVSTSRASIKYGVTYLSNSFDIFNKRLEFADSAPLFYTNANDKSLNSKVINRSITVPLSLEFKLSKKVSLDVGGYAGFRIGSKTSVSYEGTDNRDIEENVSYKFGINDISYGVKGGLAYSGLGVYARYDLSNFFKSTDAYKGNVLAMGLSWSF